MRVIVGAIAVVLLTAGVASAKTDTTYRWGALNATRDQLNTPSPIASLTGVTEIAAGNSSAMALTGGGSVYTWGLGVHGELGQGNTTDSINTAVQVPGLPTIVGIAEFQDTDIAWTASGVAYGWGFNEDGGLCTGNTTDYKSPVELTNLSGVVAAAGGAGHAEYLLSSGAIVGCGENSDGQLGNGTMRNSTTPVTVSGLPAAVTQISAGNLTSSALLSDGTVYMWGRGKYGQLGDGSQASSDVPVQVELPSAARQVDSGGSLTINGQSLALLTNGAVYGWGNNHDGQLGNGTTKTNNTVPVQATALPADVTITKVISGGSTGYALDSAGDVFGFGDNSNGQVGNGTSGGNVLTPTVVLTGADMISSTADDAVAHTP
jgi:alpha-tubulin suppressor-like RCC1 family protein